MRVLCTDINLKHINCRETYTVINSSDKKYKILNDKGTYCWYSKKKFVLMEEN